MPQVEYGGVTCQLRDGETVLDGLLRSGVEIAYSCKAGTCGSCLSRAANPEALPAASQAGLKDSWRASGCFLPCICRPKQDLTLGPVAGDLRVAAHIESVERISASVLRVRLLPAAQFDYRAGQYLTLFKPASMGVAAVARSYSIASLPMEPAIELHVRILPNGQMSNWLASGGALDATVQVQGPAGHCFYVEGRESQPLILAGTGTGLAPLYGIARDALRHGHTGRIQLFHGAVLESGLYLQAELRALASAHSNFEYTPTLLNTDGPIDQAVLRCYPKPTGHRAFLCGDPQIVQSLKKKLYLGGASLNDLHADSFLPSV